MMTEYQDLFVDVAERLMVEAFRNGGATFDPLGMWHPHSGYMVGGLVPSLVISNWESATHDISRWLSDNWVMGEYVGSWRDVETGLVHIDISTNVADLGMAMGMARARNEIAIWDIECGKELRLIPVS